MSDESDFSTPPRPANWHLLRALTPRTYGSPRLESYSPEYVRRILASASPEQRAQAQCKADQEAAAHTEALKRAAAVKQKQVW